MASWLRSEDVSSALASLGWGAVPGVSQPPGGWKCIGFVEFEFIRSLAGGDLLADLVRLLEADRLWCLGHPSCLAVSEGGNFTNSLKFDADFTGNQYLQGLNAAFSGSSTGFIDYCDEVVWYFGLPNFAIIGDLDTEISAIIYKNSMPIRNVGYKNKRIFSLEEIVDIKIHNFSHSEMAVNFYSQIYAMYKDKFEVGILV